MPSLVPVQPSPVVSSTVSAGSRHAGEAPSTTARAHGPTPQRRVLRLASNTCVVTIGLLAGCVADSARDPGFVGALDADAGISSTTSDGDAGGASDGSGGADATGDPSTSEGGSSEAGASSGPSMDDGTGADADDGGADGGTSADDGGFDFKWDLGAAEDEGIVCQAASFQPTFARPKVMLVLDRSGSMKGERWTTLTEAVQTLVSSHGDALDLGVRFFPQEGITCSPSALDIPLGPDTGAAILGSMAALAPWGNTPTLPAIVAASAHLQAVATDPSGLAAPRMMILVADGDANDCGDADEVTAAISAALGAGISTHVVAVASGLTEIDAWAVAGGTGAPVAAADLASLSAALTNAATSVKSCAFALEPAPIWPSLVEVELDGVALPRVETCSGGTGFRLLGGPPWAIELCADACDVVSPSSSVDVTYRCPPG